MYASNQKNNTIWFPEQVSVLTCFISTGFTPSSFALSSHVPSRKLSSEARSTSMSLMSCKNFWLWRFNASASFLWKAIIASMYTWFASFDKTCRVRSTKSYLLQWDSTTKYDYECPVSVCNVNVAMTSVTRFYS